MQFHNINTKQRGHWSIKMNHLTIDGNKNFIAGKDTYVIVDTGTSYNLLPKSVRKDLLQHIERTSQNVSCYNYESVIAYCDYKDPSVFPDIVLSFDTTDGVPAEYIITRESYVEEKPYAFSSGSSIKIMSLPFQDVWILGLNFFDNYYTAFDQENKQVGFALKKGSPKRIKEIREQRELPAADTNLASTTQALPSNEYHYEYPLAFFALSIAGLKYVHMKSSQKKKVQLKERLIE